MKRATISDSSTTNGPAVKLSRTEIGHTGPLLPGGPLDIVFSFDTTGSMHSVIAEVKDKVTTMIKRLLADIPGLRIAVVAHGDYGDIYVTKKMDFSTDARALCDFVTAVENTGAGDAEECYELVLSEVRRDLSWSPGTTRRLIMIGDSSPHEVGSSRNIHNIDWREEARQLHNDRSVKIYGVSVGSLTSVAAAFWNDITHMTDGKHLKLYKINSIITFIMAICYYEHGVEIFDVFESEARHGADVDRRDDVGSMFYALRSSDTSLTPTAPPVAPTTPNRKVKKCSKKTIARKRHLVSTKVRQSLAPRMRRELLSRREFSELKHLRWSSWKPAFTSIKPAHPQLWRPFGEAFCKKKPFRFSPSMQRLYQYELAVQPRPGAKRTVVYTKILRINSRTSKNEIGALVTRNTAIRLQLERVLRNAVTVYLRRAEIPQKSTGHNYSDGHKMVRKLHQSLRKQFSYAWASGRPLRDGAASVSYRIKTSLKKSA